MVLIQSIQGRQKRVADRCHLLRIGCSFDRFHPSFDASLRRCWPQEVCQTLLLQMEIHEPGDRRKQDHCRGGQAADVVEHEAAQAVSWRAG